MLQRRLFACILTGCLTGAVWAQSSAPERKFKVIGIGGGGATFGPASSPHDPKLMFVSCDMSGFYRSEDGGQSWQLLDFRQVKASLAGRPVFHPRDPQRIYFAGLVSHDRGLTWSKINPQAPYRTPRVMGIDPDDGSLLLAADDSALFVSKDAGQSWQACPSVKGKVVQLYVDPTSTGEKRRIFVATDSGLYRSDDCGSSFQEKCQGLPHRELRDLAGGRSAADAKHLLLYCALKGNAAADTYSGGVYRSRDLGESWELAMGAGLPRDVHKKNEWAAEITQYFKLGVPAAKAETVYVTCKNSDLPLVTVFRSDDSGANWRAILFREPYLGLENKVNLVPDTQWAFWAMGSGWGGILTREPNWAPFYVNPQHPDQLLWTDYGEGLMSEDGGQHWRGMYTKRAPGQKPPTRQDPGRWQTIGYEVTGMWGYYVDPFEPQRHYMPYTDIGFLFSTDGGQSWQPRATVKEKQLWSHRYQMAFDPEVPGLAWCAMSMAHDISTWGWMHDKVKNYQGGVAVTRDHCENWSRSNSGLPEGPCTSVILDPKSPKEARVLYCCIYGHGIYKSLDGGQSWVSKSKGLKLEENPHVFRIALHPDGTLFAVVIAQWIGSKKFATPGALYRSKDGGEHWEDIGPREKPLYWPGRFDVHPQNSQIIYLPAGTVPDNRQGGLYRTTDGGGTWTRLLGEQDFVGKGGPWGTTLAHCHFVRFDPENPKVIYLGTEEQGLWVSSDDGQSWKQFEDLPFAWPWEVSWHPKDHNIMYICTYGGGAWKGPNPFPVQK